LGSMLDIISALSKSCLLYISITLSLFNALIDR
jgi:hypothetical protein